MAFKIPDGQEVKDFGFSVYMADTGERYDDMSGRWGYIEGIDSDGNLFNECYNIPKEGKYIIQFFPSGRYMRY